VTRAGLRQFLESLKQAFATGAPWTSPGNPAGGARRATKQSRANPRADAAMKLLLPGAPNPERLRREAHFVQCNVIVCI